VLTPIAKSWPSEWCLEANSLAIQIHGGYGYTRDFPVEQYWRDNRLNMIHEGTHGIQALDLLGRKVVMQEGRGLAALAAGSRRRSPSVADCGAVRARRCADRCAPPRHRGDPGRLGDRRPEARLPTRRLPAGVRPHGAGVDLARRRDPCRSADADDAEDPLRAACSPPSTYFFRYELPRIGAWLKVVETRDDTCRTMAEEWF
jgi:butyryl-CoA dehydrogenase